MDAQLAEYMTGEGLSEVEEIHPDKFVRWIFPKLVARRRPLYQDIAARYGYTVEAGEIDKVGDETDFLALIHDTVKAQAQAA